MTTFAPPTSWYDACAYLGDFFAGVRVDDPPAGDAHSLEGLDVDGRARCRWTVSHDGKVLAAWDPQHLLHGYFGGDRHDLDITYGVEVNEIFREVPHPGLRIARVVQVLHLDGGDARCHEWGLLANGRARTVVLPVGDLLDPRLWVQVEGGLS